MAAGDAAAFQRLVNATNAQDLEAGLEVVSDDVRFHARRSSLEGDYLGHAGMRRFWADNQESFDVFQIDVPDLRDLGDRLVVLGTIRVRGRGGGVETEIPVAGVAWFADGKLTRWHDYGDRDALEQAEGIEL